MKWLIVLVAMHVAPDGTSEHFILTEPNFTSLEHCQTSARANLTRIEQLYKEQFNGPGKTYCFNEERLREYLTLRATTKRKRTQGI
jgi:hypothetical protein